MVQYLQNKWGSLKPLAVVDHAWIANKQQFLLLVSCKEEMLLTQILSQLQHKTMKIVRNELFTTIPDIRNTLITRWLNPIKQLTNRDLYMEGACWLGRASPSPSLLCMRIGNVGLTTGLICWRGLALINSNLNTWRLRQIYRLCIQDLYLFLVLNDLTDV